MAFSRDSNADLNKGPASPSHLLLCIFAVDRCYYNSAIILRAVSSQSFAISTVVSSEKIIDDGSIGMLNIIIIMLIK
jgi:hypothetical protein